jgi:phage shock protein PspC (stress-responsive transcriptional regulator)
MRKVTTISLNNNAYPIEEEGYESLRSYLATAERNLLGNPDRAEILADLEQAIGEKCRSCLGVHKTVITQAEVERILAEMGPVVSPAEGAAASGAGNTSSGPGSAAPASSGSARKRLYRLEDGRMWAGVCTGLGAYFGFDPVWVRVAFILLTIFSSGIVILVYIGMCFIVPTAETAEERAAAHGAPFNAQELIDSIKKNSEGMKDGSRRKERRARRRMQRHYWSTHEADTGSRPGYVARITGGLLLPVLTVLSAAWFVAMAIALLAVWGGYGHLELGAWSAQAWNPQLPRWAAIALVLVIFALVGMPLAAGRRAAIYYANGGRPHGWAHAWSGLLWLALVGTAFLFSWQYVPGVQELIRGLLQTSTHAAGWI